MTGYELIDISLSYQDAWITHVMNFVTVFTAYLICAYLIGDKLSRLQLWVINVAYTMFTSGAGIFAYINQNRFHYYTQMALERSPDATSVIGERVPPPEFAAISVILLILAYAASLVFMFQTRRSSKG